ncbi:unnamed protein product, partial [Ectocarpus fasciculatus]
MSCRRCNSDVSGGIYHGVGLSIVCENCVSSVSSNDPEQELVTKTRARRMGVPEKQLRIIKCVHTKNPHHRGGSKLHLYVREEVRFLAESKKEKNRVQREKMDKKKREMCIRRAKADKKRKASDLNRERAEQSRLRSYARRVEDLSGVVPTPGLVSGDFCSTSTKKPRVGKLALLRRGDLWNSLCQSKTPLDTRVQVFNWATKNNRLDVTIAEAADRIQAENSLLEKIAVTEGHRVLQYLDETDRLSLLKHKPVFEENRHGLPVHNISPGFAMLCEHVSGLLDKPFAT